MFIHNRLTQHVLGIIMPIVRRTDCIKPRVMLAWMCWLRLCGARTRGFIQSVLLTIGVMIPETCWVNLLWINIYTSVICWFFLLLMVAVARFANAPKCHRNNYYSVNHLDSIKPVSYGIRPTALPSVNVNLVTRRYRICLFVQVDKGREHKNQILWTTKNGYISKTAK